MLTYSYIEPTDPVGIPPRLPNGGLYGGAPAVGAWGNVPIEPEAHKMVEHLKSVHATAMIPGYTRPGNNTQTFPAHTTVPNQSFLCVKK